MSYRKSILVLTSAVCLWCGTAAVPLRGQDEGAGASRTQVPSGVVTGEVTDVAAHSPVRFAQVKLVPKPPDTEDATSTSIPVRENPPRPDRVSFVAGTTGIDGRFRLEGVPAGDYLICAAQRGYVVPGQTMIASFTQDAKQLREVEAAFETVQVRAGGVVQVHLRLQRGGVLEGTVSFEGGSPVIGTAVSAEAAKPSVLPPGAEHLTVSPLQGALQVLTALVSSPRLEFITDDAGRYRIYGLPPGRYVVETVLPLDHNAGYVNYEGGGGGVTQGRAHMFPEIVPVYAPAAFDRAQARVVEIHGGETVSDVDVEFRMGGLHGVRGRVVVPGGHALTGALVTLKRRESADAGRNVEVEADGSFELHDLPPGSYALAVFGSERHDVDGAGGNAATPILFFGTKQRIPVVVADQDVVLGDVALVPLKAGEMPEGMR